MTADVIVMADPRVTDLPATDCGQPLVDLRDLGLLVLDRRKADADGSFAHVRREVAERLADAAALLPSDLRFRFVEGYRPPALQRTYFTAYRDRLRALHPDMPDGELDLAASRYVSPPHVAPHSAGAAIDLTLCTADGTELPMGTAVNASPEESRLRCYTAAPDIDRASRANRDAMGRALSAAGFVNYPTEWWHWSYGDRYWAMATGRGEAVYGPVDREPIAGSV
ncbi:D-alanyl-D-alanine dipeptidase [Streptomyces sp. TLI_235]|nr:M15 family metallopeptidase [Streptomyces sp. TLI_235]PBC70144.1 D-alanyl-D-alanine dipeptidase [Streptomyces sp. TLI_235]